MSAPISFDLIMSDNGPVRGKIKWPYQVRSQFFGVGRGWSGPVHDFSCPDRSHADQHSLCPLYQREDTPQ